MIDTLDLEDRVERYLRQNPDATVPELAAGVRGLSPAQAEQYVNTGPSTPAEHYQRDGVADVYEELGAVDGRLCLGNQDFTGWYNQRDLGGQHAGEARPWALAKEWPTLRDGVDRVVYASINYSPKSWFMNAWEPFDWADNGREWPEMDSSGNTPGYDEIPACAPFADIDLIDEVKKQRPSGDIPRDAVERALSLYVEAFADMAGGREHVFALDSVGGAYVMIGPAVTLPIAQEFEGDDRRRLFDELADRLNDWLAETREWVNEQVPAVADTFEPDRLNNKNRLYKAPLSVHSSLDGVVTPMDTADPSYTFTPLSETDSGVIAACEEWAAGFTDTTHSAAVEALVSTLWPDATDGADGWRDALHARVDALDAEEQHTRTDDAQLRLSDNRDLSDIESTRDIADVNDAIEDVDVASLAKDVADKWDTDPGRDPKRFAPSWRTSDSETSCYADSNKFYDLEANAGGGPLKLAALGDGVIRDASHTLRGEDYWRAVNALRGYGYDIPRYLGEDGTHPDALELFDDPESIEEQRRQLIFELEHAKTTDS